MGRPLKPSPEERQKRKEERIKQTQIRFQDFLDTVKKFPNRFGVDVHNVVRRFYSDQQRSLENKEDFPYILDLGKATRVITFIEKLKQVKGNMAKMPLALFPHQVFIIVNLFGWIHKETGFRRFKLGYISQARRGGKSTLLGGIALYMTGFDGESSGEGYVIANSRDQAGKLFDSVVQIAKASNLSNILKIQQHSIIHPSSNGSFLKKVSAQAGTAEGGNVSFFVYDEIKDSPNSHLYSAYRGGMGSRNQPLGLSITTAGTDKGNFGFQLETYSKALLKGETEDDSFFAMIFACDPEDKVGDEETWIKANPSLGINISIDDLRQEYKQAKFSPSEMNTFISKRLNRYVEGHKEGWINPEYWQALQSEEPVDLENEPCFVGVDLAGGNGDLIAISFTFPTRGYYTFFKFYLCRKTFLRRVEFDDNRYQSWMEKGFITLMNGEKIDSDLVANDIIEASKKYKVIEVCFDPKDWQEITPKLEEKKIKVLGFSQKIDSMSVPTKVLQDMVRNKEILLQQNECFQWMASNATIYTDPNNNIKVNKPTGEAKKKIDGVIALIMSNYRAVMFNKQRQVPVKESVVKGYVFL